MLGETTPRIVRAMNRCCVGRADIEEPTVKTAGRHDGAEVALDAGP
jgi:hypothetical protein